MDLNVLGEIMRGGAEKVIEAGGTLAGGHSIADTDVKYGLSVMGFVNPSRMYANNRGMQTEYCVDSTIKAAFELGYAITVPFGCTSTYDNRLFHAPDLITYYERYIWNGNLAQGEPMEKVLESIRE